MSGKGTAHGSRRHELVWGRLREPAAPRWGHQEIVTRTTVLPFQHVHSRRPGRVCAEAGRVRRRRFRGHASIESAVPPGLRASAATVFEDEA
jgi:hypothetical protein